MKIRGCLYICLFLPLLLFGQENKSETTKKSTLYIQAGFYYKFFLNDSYIHPTEYKAGDSFNAHQFDRFRKTPGSGFLAGMIYEYTLSKHWGFHTGILYCFREDVFENKQDTVIRYGYNSTQQDIANILRYDYVNHSLEIPLMIYLSAGKYSVYAGCNISLLSFQKATYTYLINSPLYSSLYSQSEKTLYGFRLPLDFYPGLQLSYTHHLSKRLAKSYIAFQYGINHWDSFYFQAGLKIALAK